MLIRNSIVRSCSFFTGKFDYFENQGKLHALHDKVTSDNYVIASTVNSWYEEYIIWAKNNKPVQFFDQGKLP